MFASSTTTLFTILILCLLQLLAQPCFAFIEIPGGICGSDYQDGSYVGCDTGRCCSDTGYCGNDRYHCVTNCWKQCHAVDGVSSGGQRLYNISTTMNVVNATHNQYYDPAGTKKKQKTIIISGWDDDHLVVNASSSLCATSLSNIPPAQRNKYALAAFRPPRNRTVTPATTISGTYCGQCLKLTNLETGGEAKVRVVHERNVEGLELDRDTFNKLRTYDDHGNNGEDDDYHGDHLVLKYRFENCED
ncbi:unnamed protein product [Linum tenue]|uniref:Chitin-binding type-1 domain-containing protein n=1 Tax=Linum tenue TaxID=586396 RepID=A0AAV0S667_9ROSI|nr:unnamed protein product [Linum tenue]